MKPTTETKTDQIEYLATALNIIGHSNSPPSLKHDCYRLILRLQYLTGGTTSITTLLTNFRNSTSPLDMDSALDTAVTEHNAAIDMIRRDSTQLCNLLETLTYPDSSKPRGAYTNAVH